MCVTLFDRLSISTALDFHDARFTTITDAVENTAIAPKPSRGKTQRICITNRIAFSVRVSVNPPARPIGSLWR